MTNGSSPFQISNTRNISNKCTSTHRPFAWFCIDYHQIKWRIKVNIISNDYPPYCLWNSDYIWMISFKLFHVNAPVVYNLSVRWPQRKMVFASLVYYLSHVGTFFMTYRTSRRFCVSGKPVDRYFFFEFNGYGVKLFYFYFGIDTERYWCVL